MSNEQEPKPLHGIIDKMRDKALKNNPELKEMMEKTKQHFVNLASRNEAMETELESSRKVLWAMIHCKGGLIEIPDMSMALASGADAVLKTHYNTQKKVTVFRAETNSGVIIKP